MVLITSQSLHSLIEIFGFQVEFFCFALFSVTAKKKVLELPCLFTFKRTFILKSARILPVFTVCETHVQNIMQLFKEK